MTKILNPTKSRQTFGQLIDIFITHLKHHLVRSVMLFERKVRSKVVLQQRCRLHNLHQRSIHRLLVSLTLIAHNSRLGSIIGKEFLLSLFICRFDTGKVCIVDLRNVHLAHVKFGGCGNHITLIDSAKRDAIYFVRS